MELYKNKIFELEKDKMNNIEQIKNNKKFYEKEISEIKGENQFLKKLLEDKNKEIEKISKKFEIERNEFIETMKSLREIIIEKENEKNLILINQNSQSNNSNKPDKNKKNKNLDFNDKENYKRKINNNKNIKLNNGTNNNNIIKTKIKNNSKIINADKNKKTFKNKTPLKIMRNKIKSGKELKKNNSKNDLDYRKKNNHFQTKCNTNYNEINNDLYEDNYNIKYNDLEQGNILKTKDNFGYVYNINKYQQNINYNNINKNDVPNLNSIRSDFSNINDNIELKNNNNKIFDNKYITDNLKKINEDIFILERNIPELTREYKNLLNNLNSNIDVNNTENKDINLNALETQIKESKLKLEELKYYQQEILKNIYEN